MSERRRVGRIEAALGHDLSARREIPASERAALRAQARAVDVAEAKRDSDAVSRANAVYLELREAAGLTSGGVHPVDTVDQLLAELMRPGAGAGDMPNT